ncbi:hypothetical protein D3C76_1648720 [compost metagenome]
MIVIAAVDEKGVEIATHQRFRHWQGEVQLFVYFRIESNGNPLFKQAGRIIAINH